MSGIGSQAIPGTGSGGGGGSVTQGTSPWVVDVTSINGSSFNLGQQLAAASLPVVLTAAQITTLTPLSTITTVTNLGAANAAATIAADGVTPTVPGIASYAFVKTPGANTWDRAYAIVNANDTTGTGIQAVGVLAQFDDTTPGTVTENRFGNIRMSVRREMYNQIRDAAGNERGANVDSSNNLQVNLNNGGQALTYGPDNADGVTVVTTNSELTTRARVSVFNGTNWDRLYGTTNGAYVHGSLAHDAVDAGNPLKVGFRALTSPKAMTLVSNADRTDGLADLDGMQMTKLNTSFGDIISERITDTSGSSTAFSNFSAVASTRNYVTTIVVYNTSATAGFVDIRDGTGGSVLWTMPLPAGGGSVLSSASPLFKSTASTALAYDVSAALTTVYISMSGFQSKA